MKEYDCVHCGDTIVIATDPAEFVIHGETPVEHLRRTGHTHRHEPKPFMCTQCEYLWMYEGTSETPTCPNCKSKSTQRAE